MSANPPTQYRTERNLAARQRLWSTSRREPSFDLFSWVIELSGLVAGGRQQVLDVGCGNGAYEVALTDQGHTGQRVAVDLSAGMLRLVRHAERLQADVLALPLRGATFDVVLAPHMLYHVSDVEAAAREIRRVLRPGGRFVAVTNGVANLVELSNLVEAAVGTGWEMVRPADRHFSLENGGEQLASVFETVTRVDCPESHVVVTDIDAVAGYVASVADHYEAEVDTSWTEVVDRVRVLAARAMFTEGALRFSTAVGAFVCH